MKYFSDIGGYILRKIFLIHELSYEEAPEVMRMLIARLLFKRLVIHFTFRSILTSSIMKLLTNTAPYFLFLLIITSCNAGTANKEDENADKNLLGETIPSLNYDLLHPQKKWDMPDVLKEISGLSWIDSTHLLAIEDLHPNLYLLNLKDSNVVEKSIPFEQGEDKKFDVEDVAVHGNTAYALWSHGVIYAINNWRKNIEVKELKTFLTKQNNPEGLCYDPQTNSLLVACKGRGDVGDDKKSTKAIYEYDLAADKMKEEPFMVIRKKDFEKFGNGQIDFFPSAITIHPQTHDVYILSTRETKCLAQFSHDGKLKAFEVIDKELLPQPEGICFSPAGTMYISTQGRKGDVAHVYEFPSRQ